MRVYYLPEQPAGSAIVDDSAALWGTPGVLGCMGLVFTIFGLVKAIRQRGRDAVHSHKQLALLTNSQRILDGCDAVRNVIHDDFRFSLNGVGVEQGCR